MSDSRCGFISFKIYPGTYNPSGHIIVSYGCGCNQFYCYHRRYGIRTDQENHRIHRIIYFLFHR